MIIDIDNSKINGSGTQLYSVSVTESNGDLLGTALWLADYDQHLETQLYEDFLRGEPDQDIMRAYYNHDVRPNYSIECIGSVV